MHKLLPLLLLLAGCETTTNAMARQQKAWIGQPVRAFAEAYSLRPVDIITSSAGRTYLYQKPQGYGSCGVTIQGVPGGAEYVIAGMTSTCPPGSI